jgi:polyisoprenoid-binding protein YceI
MFKQMLWLCASLGAAVVPVPGQSASRDYAIEPAHTVVSFEVSNLGIVKRRGVFDDVTGTVSLDPQGGNGSVDIIVNARSIHAGDAATQAFVRGESFLNVEQYSEIVYRAERVVFADGKPSRIEGKLTLLGVTKDVSLAVSNYKCGDEQPSKDALCVIDADTSFQRSEFGMNRYLALVSDKVRLAIHGVTTLAATPLMVAAAGPTR